MGEVKEDPSEGASMGDILSVEDGDVLDVAENFLVDVDIVGEG